MTEHLTTAFLARTLANHGYDVREGPDVPITGGAAHSALVTPGDLFAAFRGEHADGNDYVDEALERGAVAVICERAPRGDWQDRTIAVVDDSRRAVAAVAHAWRRECRTTVVGITGTVGKTTAKDLVAATLSSRFPTHRSPGNFNSREGLPLAIASLRRDHQVSVLEMAMDSPGEIGELCGIAEPNIGIVINIGLTHVSKLGSIDAIQREKLTLPRSLPADGTAILNIDDTRIAPVVAELSCRVLTFGAHHDAAVRHGPITDHGLGGTAFQVIYRGEVHEVRLRMPGVHVVPAAMAAACTGLALGMPLAEVADAVSHAPVDGRMVIRRGVRGATILDDRYNSSPASLEGALRLLAGLPGQRIALLGEMAELGPFGEAEHARLGGVAAHCCDRLVATGPLCRHLVAEARHAGLAEAGWFESKEEAAREVRRIADKGDHILVKASRSQAFETIIPLLEGDA
ncbi:MAG: UDP-N-acetylmuramoyl-tripeptide--D-alanyl-D-alanine ligase [Dehalococcoidia bacterium]